MRITPLRRRLRSSASAVVTAALLASAAVGCSSDDGPQQASAESSPSASTEASASPSAEPSETPAPSESADAEQAGTVQDEVEAPEEPTGLKNNAKSRAEFTRYVVDAWIYAFISNDPKPLVDASVKGGCDGCSNLRKEMRKRSKEGYFIELVGVGVGKTNEPKKQPPDGKVTITKTSLALPESRILNEDGTLRALSPAHPDTTFTAKVKWLPPKQTKAKGKKNKKTPGELRLVSFGVETKD